MDILVIGSKGFIGNEICNFFVNKGYFVIGCDIYPVLSDKNYVCLDSINPNFSSIFKKYNFSYRINCSGSANVQLSIKEPLSDFMLNTVNVFNMLESIRKFSPTTNFINLSSAAVYGNPISLPISENTSLSPVSPYGLHKMQSE